MLLLYPFNSLDINSSLGHCLQKKQKIYGVVSKNSTYGTMVVSCPIFLPDQSLYLCLLGCIKALVSNCRHLITVVGSIGFCMQCALWRFSHEMLSMHTILIRASSTKNQNNGLIYPLATKAYLQKNHQIYIFNIFFSLYSVYICLYNKLVSASFA